MRRRGLLVGIAGFALVCAPSAGATAAPRVVERVAVKSQAEVRGYWTPERMANARPASELLAGLPAPKNQIDPGVRGTTPATRVAAQPIGDPSRAAYRMHGKVFLTNRDGIPATGDNYFCSGTVVPARHKRLVVTAGHCVYGFGEFATNWMFIPGKDGAREPYGRWTAVRLATTRQFEASEDLAYDVGMAKIAKRDGKRLQKVVGARRIAFGLGRDQRFDAFGYPADPPFSGSRLYHCPAQAESPDMSMQPPTNRIDCSMTGGASGGGWLVDGRRVNSVTSYGYDCPRVLDVCVGPDPDGAKLYGPYFGNTIRKLYKSQRRKRR